MSTEPPTIRIRLTTTAGGGMEMDAPAIALLCGVDIAEAEAVLLVDGSNGPVEADRIPLEWRKRYRQRSLEAQAHTGRVDAEAILTYWAFKDFGSSVTFEYR